MPLTHEDISTLYKEHSPMLLRYLMRRTFDAQVAVDLMAETFAVAYEQRDRQRGDDGGRAWVYGIATNLLSMFFRDGQIERRGIERLGIRVPQVEESDLARIEDLAETAELRAAVAQALTALNEEHRTALDLRVVHEHSYPEVAAALGVTEDVARARVSRGLRKLKSVLEDAAPKEAIEHA